MSGEVELEESRRDTQWDLDFRACVTGILTKEEDLSHEVVIVLAVEMADLMRDRRVKRPVGVPEPEIRRKYRLLVDAAEEVEKVLQRGDMQACPIPIALSRALDELFVALEE